MATVNGIAAVHVRTDEEAIALVRSEGVGLVRAGVGAQDRLVVDVVRVRLAPARVVGRETQRVEVLVRRDDREEGVVVFVGRRGEF